MRHIGVLALVLAACLSSSFAQAEDYVLTLKDHRYSPQELVLPADQKIKLIVKNLDDTAAEFESSDLNREKVVTAQGEITVFLTPLSPGSYTFFDDFHRATTGTIIVK